MEETDIQCEDTHAEVGGVGEFAEEDRRWDNQRPMGTSISHVIGLTCHYDVIDFVIVAKRREHAAWQQSQNQWRHNDKSIPSRDQ